MSTGNHLLHAQPDTKKSRLASIELLNGVSIADGKSVSNVNGKKVGPEVNDLRPQPCLTIRMNSSGKACGVFNDSCPVSPI